MSQAVRIGIYGASGSGKSTKANAITRSIPKLVRFDPMREHGQGIEPRRFREVLAKAWRDNFEIVVQPSYGTEAQALHQVSLALREAQERTGARTQITFCVDELNLGFPNQALPADLMGFGELCSRGRHYNVNIIGVTQRIAEVNTRWRGNLSGFYVFRQGDARDLATVAPMLPLPAHRAQLLALKNFEYLYISAGAVSRGHVSAPGGAPHRKKPGR